MKESMRRNKIEVEFFSCYFYFSNKQAINVLLIKNPTVRWGKGKINSPLSQFTNEIFYLSSGLIHWVIFIYLQLKVNEYKISDIQFLFCL